LGHWIVLQKAQWKVIPLEVIREPLHTVLREETGLIAEREMSKRRRIMKQLTMVRYKSEQSPIPNL
jgi:hypothetical protein